MIFSLPNGKFSGGLFSSRPLKAKLDEGTGDEVMKASMAVLTLVVSSWTWAAMAQGRPPQDSPPGGHMPPPQAYEDCRGKKAGDTVQHTTREGKVAATCVIHPKVWWRGPTSYRAPSRTFGRLSTPAAGTAAPLSQILGRPTDRSLTLVVISVAGVEAHVE